MRITGSFIKTKKERTKTIKTKFEKIVTHFQPGLDELAGIFLLKRHGAEMGITTTTPVEFMMNGDFENPHASDVPHILYLGCGLGLDFNEHYSEDKDTSACQLVAKNLQLSRDQYGSFVKEVTREDRHGSEGVKNHIAQTIKDLYDMGWEAIRIYRWAKTAFVALTSDKWQPREFSMDVDSCNLAIEHKFGREAAQEWYSVFKDTQKFMRKEYNKAMAYLKQNPSDFVEIETYSGSMKAYIPMIPQTNPRIAQAARSQGAMLVLMQGVLKTDNDTQSLGVVIQQKHTAHLSFAKIVEELRTHELIFCSKFRKEQLGELKGEGTIAECPIWHGHQAATGKAVCFAIYNRSKTRPLGPKTCLEWQYIVDLFISTIKVAPEGETFVGMNEFLNPARMGSFLEAVEG